MSKRKTPQNNKTSPIAPPPDPVSTESATESEFFDELVSQEVAYVEDYKENLQTILKCLREDQIVRVRDLFPSFRRDSRPHEFLRSLRKKRIARPEGGGPWASQSSIVFTFATNSTFRGLVVFLAESTSVVTFSPSEHSPALTEGEQGGAAKP